MKMNEILLFAGLPLVCGKTYAQNNEKQPNIIFVLTDDMGIGDLSIYGGKLGETPNIDRMANEGVRFTQYYSASPISSPSRAGLITGMHPANWNINSYLQTKKGNREAEMVDYLSVQAPSLPRVLKATGYKTGHFGKWHLGGGRDVTNAPMFDEYGYDEYSSTYESPAPDPLLTATNWIWSAKDSIPRWDRTAYFIDKTIDFMKRNQDSPCFVNLWPDDMHTPWIGNKEEMDLVPDGTESQKNFKTVLLEYDKQIGYLLSRLKEEGLSKNTIVIFASDNGPAPSFDHSRTNNLRGCKASLFEGGIRMPFIVWSSDGLVAKSRVDDTSVISAVDIFPSVCALANVALPTDYMGDGENMSKALTGTPQKRNKAIVWEYRRNNSNAFPKAKGIDASPNLAIRDDNWKLLVNDDESETLLFNLEEDVYEQKNVAEEYPQITEKLKKKVLSWRRSMPVLKADNE